MLYLIRVSEASLHHLYWLDTRDWALGCTLDNLVRTRERSHHVKITLRWCSHACHSSNCSFWGGSQTLYVYFYCGRRQFENKGVRSSSLGPCLSQQDSAPTRCCSADQHNPCKRLTIPGFADLGIWTVQPWPQPLEQEAVTLAQMSTPYAGKLVDIDRRAHTRSAESTASAILCALSWLYSMRWDLPYPIGKISCQLFGIFFQPADYILVVHTRAITLMRPRCGFHPSPLVLLPRKRSARISWRWSKDWLWDLLWHRLRRQYIPERIILVRHTTSTSSRQPWL